MISRVLVPMDGSEMSEHALEYALEVHPECDVTVLHVVGGPSPMWGEATSLALAEDIEAVAEERAESVFERAREIAADEGYTGSVETQLAFGHPVSAILDQAEDADVVVLGSHGGTLAERLFVGNIAETIFRRSPVPVTVVR